jgi:hypothetical protein
MNNTPFREDVIRLIERLDMMYPPAGRWDSRLVRLPHDRSIVFVGDIHGDRDAVEGIFSRFPSSDHVILFLGDIVDRGSDSLGSLSLVVDEMLRAPASVYLLMGNHEARGVSRFTPADFWESVPQDLLDALAQHLMRLPLAAWHHDAGVLATHAGLPDCCSLEAIDDIELGSREWRDLTWGDWVDSDRQAVASSSRPAYGPTAFERRISQMGVRLLIRSHQPTAPRYLFADRCLTLFTSAAYGDGARRVAVLSPERNIATVRDLQLVEI